ncbi:MAG: DUF4231 domain-containing protein [Nitrososphaeraceae archaeon]
MKLRDIPKYRVIKRYFQRSKQSRQVNSSLAPVNSKNELDYYYHFDVTKPPKISDYIENRFLPIFRQYKNNARINTRRLRIWRVSIIVLTVFMIIFNVIVISSNSNSPGIKSSSIIAMGIVSSIAAALILGFTAFLQLTKSQENWFLYSTISEKLEREYNLFKFKGGPYSLSTNDEKEGESGDVNKINKLFVEIVENIILTQGSEPRPRYSSSTTTAAPTNHHDSMPSSTTTSQE